MVIHLFVIIQKAPLKKGVHPLLIHLCIYLCDVLCCLSKALMFNLLCAAELFTDVQPYVQSALDGYNVSIFAYGQTHSGKTHTMVSLSLSIYIYIYIPIFICIITYA